MTSVRRSDGALTARQYPRPVATGRRNASGRGDLALGELEHLVLLAGVGPVLELDHAELGELARAASGRCGRAGRASCSSARSC